MNCIYKNSMPRIVDNYSLNQMLGEGQYGKVYKAIHTKTKLQYAVKIVPVSRFRQIPKLQECTQNQLQTLSNISPCPHIVSFKQMLRTANNFYFVYEFCNGGTLQKMLKSQGRLPQSKALLLFKQLLQAFRILQKYNIMHRDIKPDNILFHNGVLKLGDFGFCKILGDTDTHVTATMIGSPIYMAPEILKGERYASKADIWSLGVVLFEMLFGYCPFEESSIAKLISKVEEGLFRIPLNINPVSQETQELLNRMLTKRPEQRIDWQSLFALQISQEGVLRLTKPEKSQNLTTNENIWQSLSCNLSGLPRQPQGLNNTSLVQTLTLAPPQIPTTTSKFIMPQALSYQALPKLPNFLSASQKSTSKISSSITSTHLSQPSSLSPSCQLQRSPSLKRKQILQDHSFCTSGIKTACDFSQSDDPQALVYGYLLLKRSQERLKKICEQISVMEIEFEDVMFAINSQLRQLEREVGLLKEELISNGMEIRVLNDPKRYLNSKWNQNEGNIRGWFDMVSFLFGDRGVSKEGMNTSDMVISIKAKLLTL